MACESCKAFVRDALDELDIATVKVDLVEIETKEDVSDVEKKKLYTKIRKVGLELLEKKKGALIEKIRKVIIDHVYNTEEKPTVKFSVLLSKKLHLNYAYLANFSLR